MNHPLQEIFENNRYYLEKLNSLIQLIVYIYIFIYIIIDYYSSRMITWNTQQYLKEDLLILSCYFLFYKICKLQKETWRLESISIPYIICFEFLLCNVLHSVGNIYWRRFVRGLFRCHCQEIISATRRAPETHNF